MSIGGYRIIVSRTGVMIYRSGSDGVTRLLGINAWRNYHGLAMSATLYLGNDQWYVKANKACELEWDDND